jgi:aryl-alcohol dehydrogenase-like predicted oxidoreductase
MKYNQFGNTDLKISEIGLGASHFGSMLDNKNRDEVSKTILKALDAGINFCDTADIYGQGESEILIGKTFKGKRDKVVIASKAGYKFSSTGKVFTKLKPLVQPFIASTLKAIPSAKKYLQKMRTNNLEQDFSGKYLVKAIEASLKRLNTDYLDLFQLHSPSILLLENSDFIESLELLKKQGKIRYYGIACDTTDDALACLQYPEISSLQVEINILNQDAIARLLPLTQKKKVAVIARQPFASGLLLQLFRKEPDDLNDAMKKKILELQKHLQINSKLYEEFVSNPSHMALQFLLQQNGISVTIIGMRSQRHLEDNLSAIREYLTVEELSNLVLPT